MKDNCPYLKNVLVTGASSGIGKETADLFAMKGFKVYAASRHPQETKNPNIIPIEMDVTDPASVQKAASSIDELGIIIPLLGADVQDFRCLEDVGRRVGPIAGAKGGEKEYEWKQASHSAIIQR